MKIALITLIALAASASTWAGNNGGVTLAPLPDAGTSALLLSIGVGALGIACRAFRRR